MKQVVFLLDACRNDAAAGRSDTSNPMTNACRDLRLDVTNREVEAFATLHATAVGQRAYEYRDRDTGPVRGGAQHGVAVLGRPAGLADSRRVVSSTLPLTVTGTPAQQAPGMLPANPVQVCTGSTGTAALSRSTTTVTVSFATQGVERRRRRRSLEAPAYMFEVAGRLEEAARTRESIDKTP